MQLRDADGCALTSAAADRTAEWTDRRTAAAAADRPDFFAVSDLTDRTQEQSFKRET